MNNKFHEMLKKKRDMSPSEKHAKMSVIHDMKKDLAGHAGDKFDGLKKVSVMSNSPQGIQEGLDKAKDIVSDPGDDMSPMQASMPGMSDGGMYDEGGEIQEDPRSQTSDNEHNEGQDPDAREKQTQALAKALGYAKGGKIKSPAEDIMHEIDEETESHEAEPGKSLDHVDESVEEPMGHIGADMDMTHEHLEDLDLDEINKRIAHLMQLQKKAESKK